MIAQEIKVEYNDNDIEICSQCKQPFKGSKYLEVIRKIWLCVKCYYKD